MLDVVLVDDAPAAKRSLRAIIETRGGEFRIVGEASNGREALALLEDALPDVAFVDVRMPEMDGLELAGEIRRRSWPIEIVIVSGYGQFEYAQRAMHYQVTDYLLKPVDPEEVAELLTSIAGRLNGRDSTLADQIRHAFDEGSRLSDLVEDIWNGNAARVGAQLEELHIAFSSGSLSPVLSEVYEHLAIRVEAELGRRSDGVILFPPPPGGGGNPRDQYRVCRRYLEELIQAVTRHRDVVRGGPVAECVEYLESNYRDRNITLLSLAERAGLSPSYFSRKFKEEVGKPYGEYLIEVRLEAARSLLHDRRLLVYQVAERVGYGDYAHFERTFHKRFGLSPTEYRENPHKATWNGNSRHTG